ncbi:MAG: hypothetical protein H7Y17_05405 [Chlorobia bacterium]|nr:hypothetical protein [Fimbriimonadaceae bacterium]
MKPTLNLTIASMLSILFVTLHISDDIARGLDKAGIGNLVAGCVLALWLYGTLMLAERKSGYIVILIFSILSLGVVGIHMKGEGIPNRITLSSGGVFYVWTLYALTVSAFFSVLLSIRGLSNMRRSSQS